MSSSLSSTRSRLFARRSRRLAGRLLSTRRRLLRTVRATRKASPSSLSSRSRYAQVYLSPSHKADFSFPPQLSVLYPRSTTDEWTFPSGWLSESKRTKSKPLPDLQKALVVGVFNQVTSLKLVNVYVPPSVLPTLLGPGKAVRRNLQSFALYSDTQDLVSTSNDLHFLLEALQFFASEPEFVTDYPDQKPEFADRYPEGCDSDAITKTLLSEAHTDYSLFSKLFKLEWADWDGPLESYFERAQPRDISPWSSLKILDLQLFSSLALALIIYSPAFPVLRRLTLCGVAESPHRFERGVLLAFRRAAHSCVRAAHSPLPSILLLHRLPTLPPTDVLFLFAASTLLVPSSSLSSSLRAATPMSPGWVSVLPARRSSTRSPPSSVRSSPSST